VRILENAWPQYQIEILIVEPSNTDGFMFTGINVAYFRHAGSKLIPLLPGCFMDVKRISAIIVFLLCLPVLSLGASPLPEVNRGHLPKLLHKTIKLSDGKMSEAPPESYEWEWTGAVLMIGLAEMFELTGDKRYLAYIKRWADHHIKRGYTLSKSDQVVPGLLLIKLYRATSESRYIDHAERIGRYVTEEALRTNDGGLVHFGPMGGKSMWIDSLFMLCPFLVELAKITGEEKYLDEAVKQSLIMYGHLQDPQTGLCKHYWDETKNKTNTDHWLRGNAWALAANAILLEALPNNYDAESRARLLEHFRKHVHGIATGQDESGLWHTVLDNRETYLESSGTALVAFAIFKAVDAGLIDPAYLRHARRALRGLMDYVRIHPDGFCTIDDVSLGTRPGNAAYYNQVTRAENVPYGVGAFAMAVGAYCNNERYEYDPATMRVEDGWEELRWGRIDKAQKAMIEALELDPNSVPAHFGAGFVIFADTLTTLIEAVTDMSVEARGVTPPKLQRRMVEEFAPAFGKVSGHFGKVEADEKFTQVTERLIFLGGTSFGYIQWDVAEVYMLDAVAGFLEAAFYFIGSYDIDGPPVLIVRRKFGKIVRDKSYPHFLTLNDKSGELLPKSRAALAKCFSKIKAMVENLERREKNYPGRLITLDLLRLRGTLSIPGVVEPQPPTALVSKNIIIRELLKFVGRNVPEKLPGWMEKARYSLLENRTVPITKKIGINLAVPFDNPKDLRDLFPKHKPDGSGAYPDPTLGGLLPGMTNKTLNRLMNLL